MLHSELILLVKEMREAQKRWFGGDKTQTQLSKCKSLEAKVDAAIAENEAKLGRQIGMFG